MAKRKRVDINIPKDQPKPRRKRTKAGKPFWGNTNKARGKIRRWQKARAEVTGLPPTSRWRKFTIHQLTPEQVDQLRADFEAGDIELSETVLDEIYGSTEPDIYRMEFDIYRRPETQEVPLIEYQTRQDFTIKDLFTARGKNWKQGDKSFDGFSDDFDYFIFEIETGVPTE